MALRLPSHIFSPHLQAPPHQCRQPSTNHRRTPALSFLIFEVIGFERIWFSGGHCSGGSGMYLCHLSFLLLIILTAFILFSVRPASITHVPTFERHWTS
ncbi:hypothetical protein B0H12DRAFT_1114077 [Mycena haematopus]|nr:hypothetical protein B0H12DRAFT_1114077 [Mycena haematopus]